LADNPLGFPGHCYVMWTLSDPPPGPEFQKQEAVGYLTTRYWDQIPALWTRVPGGTVDNAAEGNSRYVDRLSVLVNKADYDRTRAACASWRKGYFEVG